MSVYSHDWRSVLSFSLLLHRALHAIGALRKEGEWFRIQDSNILTSCLYVGALDMKSSSSWLLMKWGFLSLLVNLFTPNSLTVNVVMATLPLTPCQYDVPQRNEVYNHHGYRQHCDRQPTQPRDSPVTETTKQVIKSQTGDGPRRNLVIH